MTRAAFLLAAMVLLASSTGARQLQQFSSAAVAPPAECSIPEGQEVNTSKIVASCSPPADVCSTCICGTFDVFWGAIKASGATWDPNDPSSLASLIGTIGNVNRACLLKYESDIRSALGPTFNDLRQIGNCSWLTSPSVPAPECHQKQLYSLASANLTQSNSSGSSLQVVLQNPDGRDDSTANTGLTATVLTSERSERSEIDNSTQSASAPGVSGAPPASLATSPGPASSSSNGIHKITAWLMVAAGCLSVLWL